jgi:hypothetical protein
MPPPTTKHESGRSDASTSVPRTGRRGASPAASLTLFIALAILHTWPLATAPGTLSRNDNGDAVLHEWILAWVAHQIVTDPLHLFDANIFHPERYTLAYSDHMLVQSLLGAPMLWAGASPVLVHNLVLIAGLALTGWTTSLVVRHWTGSWLAGVVSGSLVAFNAFTLTRLPQLQDLHLEFFPLALLALDRLLDAPRVRHALTLAGAFVLQSLAGTYLMVFTFLSLVAAAVVRPREWMHGRWRGVAACLVLAALTALAALTPFLLPYYYAREAVGLGRSLEDTARYSAELTDYLAAPGRIHFEWWGRRFFQGDALFPGFVALALACAGIAAHGFRDRRARMVLAIGVAAFAFSFGPAFPPYRWLYGLFPLLSGIRGAVRFGQFALAAIGILAGFGVMAILRRSPSKAGHALVALLLAGVHVEALRAPLFYSEFHGIPPIYDALRDLSRRAVLVWLPFPSSPQFHLNAPYMLASTRTFNPTLNGYSGFKPPSYYQHVEALKAFPDETSIRYLQKLDVTVAIVDGQTMRPANLARLSEFPMLSLWKADGPLRIYLLARPASQQSFNGGRSTNPSGYAPERVSGGRQVVKPLSPGRP